MIMTRPQSTLPETQKNLPDPEQPVPLMKKISEVSIERGSRKSKTDRSVSLEQQTD